MTKLIPQVVQIGFLLFVASQQMSARFWCTNADFSGAYAVTSSGQIVIAPPDRPIVGPFARVARLVSFGDGTLIANYARGSYTGIIYSEPFDGTYSVNSDCTILFLINAPAPTNLTVAFVGLLSRDLREVELMAGGPGAVVTATMRRQKILGCSTADFGGSFQLQLSGTVLPPAPTAGPFLRLGLLVSLGNGTFTAATNATYGGFFTPEPISGTYTVDFDCKLVLNYSVTGPAGTQAFTIEGVLSDKDHAFLMVTSPPGAAIAGSLKRQ